MLPVFGVSVSMTFHLRCVHIIFGSVSVAERPLFGKQLLTRSTICSLCILTICNISYFLFGFEGWIWVLIVSVPDLCILFTCKTPLIGRLVSGFQTCKFTLVIICWNVPLFVVYCVGHGRNPRRQIPCSKAHFRKGFQYPLAVKEQTKTVSTSKTGTYITKTMHIDYIWQKPNHAYKSMWCRPPFIPLYMIKLWSTGLYIIFLVLLQIIDSGYSLEPPQWASKLRYWVFVRTASLRRF